MWASLIEGLVKGLLMPLIQFWSTKRLGKKEQQVEDLKATLDLEHKIADAVAAAGHPTVSDTWLKSLPSAHVDD